MVYTALLRGINVGGKNKIDMKILRNSFKNTGMQNVLTYINSGNIIFTNDKFSKEEITTALEKEILNDFGLDIKVLVLNIDEYEAVLKKLPEEWTNDDKMKSDVMFLWEEIINTELNEKLEIKSGIDNVIYAPGAILWSTKRKDVTKSGKMKLAGTKLYRRMTIRNVNTTRKIFELMLSVNE